jgi:hypothetical protein
MPIGKASPETWLFRAWQNLGRVLRFSYRVYCLLLGFIIASHKTRSTLSLREQFWPDRNERTRRADLYSYARGRTNIAGRSD